MEEKIRLMTKKLVVQIITARVIVRKSYVTKNNMPHILQRGVYDYKNFGIKSVCFEF